MLFFDEGPKVLLQNIVKLDDGLENARVVGLMVDIKLEIVHNKIDPLKLAVSESVQDRCHREESPILIRHLAIVVLVHIVVTQTAETLSRRNVALAATLGAVSIALVEQITLHAY